MYNFFVFLAMLAGMAAFGYAEVHWDLLLHPGLRDLAQSWSLWSYCTSYHFTTILYLKGWAYLLIPCSLISIALTAYVTRKKPS